MNRIFQNSIYGTQDYTAPMPPDNNVIVIDTSWKDPDTTCIHPYRKTVPASKKDDMSEQCGQNQESHGGQEKWFDIYGDYTYPTDYVLSEPNIGSATQEGMLAFVASRDASLPG